MKKYLLQILVVGSFILVFAIQAFAHCEIPCGIYDDEMRIDMINEHIDTIEKSMNQIMELEKAEHHHSNQLVRWIMNKEHHADEIQEIVSQYFLTQRIKPDAKDYEKKLKTLHQMLIYSMKCKQTGFAGTDDLRRIIFATLRNTRKYANIKTYPRISILIDSRSNRVEDFEDAMALTALGNAHEAEGEERERLSGLFLARQPHLKEFLRNTDCALMILEVERYIMVTRFQQVMEMDISPCP